MIFYRVRIERHKTDEKENEFFFLIEKNPMYPTSRQLGILASDILQNFTLRRSRYLLFHIDFGRMESLQPGVLQGLLAPCRCLLNLIGFAIAIGIFLVCVQSSQTLNRKQNINGGMTLCMYILSLINIGKLTLSFEGWGPDDWHMFTRASWCQQQ